MIEFAVRSTRIFTPEGPREGAVLVEKLPPAPEGFEVTRVDVVVRLRRKA